VTNRRGWRPGTLVGLAMLLGSAPLTGQGLDRTILPIVTPEYQGKIVPSREEAVPYWPPLVQALADAPNVLLVMTDDVGFSAAGTFGGPVPMLNLDRLA